MCICSCWFVCALLDKFSSMLCSVYSVLDFFSFTICVYTMYSIALYVWVCMSTRVHMYVCCIYRSYMYGCIYGVGMHIYIYRCTSVCMFMYSNEWNNKLNLYWISIYIRRARLWIKCFTHSSLCIISRVHENDLYLWMCFMYLELCVCKRNQ